MLIKLGYPEEEVGVSNLYGYGLWWDTTSSNNPVLLGCNSLVATDNQYIDGLEKILSVTAPLFEEPGTVTITPVSLIDLLKN